MLAPNNISIGSGTHINQSVFLDGRGGIEIEKNVSISHYVKIVTGSHDVQSARFEGKFDKVRIDDNSFLGCDCKILQGVTIGKGAVVCSGAVVTKNDEDYSIVAGIPARKIGERNKELIYSCRPQEFFR